MKRSPPLIGLLVAWASTAHAYVGPGAGFALAGSAWTFLVLIVAALSALVLPVRFALLWWRRSRSRGQARVRRVVVVGLDGFDPGLAQRWMDEGLLPNLSRLRDQGSFGPLKTTLPAITPSAWSTFQTGVDASRHNIFDFVTRDPKTYQPLLSSAELVPASRTMPLGRYRIPLRRARVRGLRKSQPFWKILGARGIFSTIVRVPITFPPESFNGVLLAGMCVPDLRGTQGEFTLFSSAPDEKVPSHGQLVRITLEGQRGRALFAGPAHPFRPGAGPLQAEVGFAVEGAEVVLRVGKEAVRLKRGQFSPWLAVRFAAGLGIGVYGICRFYLLGTDPLRIYATPLHLDPEHPGLPLSHPAAYALYLAKRLGRFATLGLAEDTDALNDGVLDEDGFLEQAYAFHQEREAMLLQSLATTREGLVVCVFDGPDRIQHMFYRTLDPTHPANTHREVAGYTQVIPQLYQRMDQMIGRVRERLGEDPNTVLLVISDHGFCNFRRGVNLNTWLHANGYLALKEGASRSGEWFAQVDWSRTRAFALGLSGIYLNRQGREAQGVVAAGEELAQLKAELIGKLGGMVDEETGAVAINKVWDTETHFTGPYTMDAPDLLVGYNSGYRISWGGASGVVGTAVFEDNTRPWSGDHCVDPGLVPGVFFCDRKVQVTDPALIDMPVSILRLLGVDAPAYMQGRDLFVAEKEAR
ncbi:MAG: alkaline phosphatase family protein [Candidatus Latescibacteria bacterium]|nr:alkaline phosphatase family protein [Candidatus Latescibacterota bacterium]